MRHSTEKMGTTAEMLARLEAIKAEKRGRVRWQMSQHTAETAIAAIALRGATRYRPGSKSRRRKRHKRLL